MIGWRRDEPCELDLMDLIEGAMTGAATRPFRVLNGAVGIAPGAFLPP